MSPLNTNLAKEIADEMLSNNLFHTWSSSWEMNRVRGALCSKAASSIDSI